jgi:hypothetical protein
VRWTQITENRERYMAEKCLYIEASPPGTGPIPENMDGLGTDNEMNESGQHSSPPKQW